MENDTLSIYYSHSHGFWGLSLLIYVGLDYWMHLLYSMQVQWSIPGLRSPARCFPVSPTQALQHAQGGLQVTGQAPRQPDLVMSDSSPSPTSNERARSTSQHSYQHLIFESNLTDWDQRDRDVRCHLIIILNCISLKWRVFSPLYQAISVLPR